MPEKKGGGEEAGTDGKEARESHSRESGEREASVREGRQGRRRKRSSKEFRRTKSSREDNGREERKDAGRKRSEKRPVRRVRSSYEMKSRRRDGKRSSKSMMEERPSSRLADYLAAREEDGEEEGDGGSYRPKPGEPSVISSSSRLSSSYYGSTRASSVASSTDRGSSSPGGPSAEVIRALGPSPRIVAIHGDFTKAGEVALSRGLLDGQPASVSLPSDMLMTYFPAGTCSEEILNTITHSPQPSGGDAGRLAYRALRRHRKLQAIPTIEGGVIVLFPKRSFPRPDISTIHHSALPEVAEDELSSEDEEEAKVAPGDDCVCVIA